MKERGNLASSRRFGVSSVRAHREKRRAKKNKGKLSSAKELTERLEEARGSHNEGNCNSLVLLSAGNGIKENCFIQVTEIQT